MFTMLSESSGLKWRFPCTTRLGRVANAGYGQGNDDRWRQALGPYQTLAETQTLHGETPSTFMNMKAYP